MKVVILAGGKGTRLGSLTRDIPKPMVPLLGKPLVAYQLDLVKRYGFTEVIFVVNHLGQVIEDYFGNGEKLGLQISYFHESTPLGTVGGIKEMEAQLNEDFLVLYGDVMMEMDLNRLLQFHKTKQSEATLVVHPNDHPHDSDLVEMDEDGRISNVLPKPHPAGISYRNMVNAAAYIFSPVIFNYLQKGVKADFGRDIFPAIYQKVKMYGYNTPEYLKDMGTPERLEQVAADIESGKVKRRSLEQPQKAIFLDRDGVLNKDNNLISNPIDFELYPFAADAVKRINTSDYLAIVVTNQSVIARNLTTIEGLNAIHKKMDTELGADGAKIDALYFCPHHPDKGYPEENPDFKIDCDCRKPKPGMLLQAAEQFNIDLSLSILIGDAETDVQAGLAAGCTTIGLRSGRGYPKARVMPHYFFDDVNEAVHFIFDEKAKKSCQSIIEQALAYTNSTKPFGLAIGGHSRSGKSNLASHIEKRLQLAGKKVLRINLDDWIIPKSERTEENSVLTNFRLGTLNKDLQKIGDGQSVQLEAYQVHPNWPLVLKTYELAANTDVILWEGVVALCSKYILQKADLKIFTSYSETERYKRFIAFYDWKGLNATKAHELWESRQKTEFATIEASKKEANKIIEH